MKRDDLIAVMMSFVGTQETPPGSNMTVIGQEYGWNGVAWCAETVSVACNRLGFPLHEAAVSRIEQRARAGNWGMSWTNLPIRGSAAIFDWKGHGNPADMHVGVVKDVNTVNQFWCIEGNYRDRCAVVLRDMAFVRGFAKFPFEDPTAPTAPAVNPHPISTNKDLTEKLMDAPVLKKNSPDRQHVGILQALLTWHAPDLAGDKNRFVDGSFGDNTERVLTEWQRRTKVLQADGVCGPQTWAWLCGV